MTDFPGPIQPEVNGEFYIDDVSDNFWLRELNAWEYKGRLYRADTVGMISAGPFPFKAGQIFELAPSTMTVHYYPDFSASRSKVSCEYPTHASCEIVFTDNLAGFLSTGTNVICTATFEGVAQNATLVFSDIIVPAFTPVWLVMPASADPTMAGLRALFAGDPR